MNDIITVKNPRTEDGFYFPDLKCSRCSKITSCYILIENKLYCKSCLIDMQKTIEQT